MVRITALVHTCNDGLRLGRCLETLHPCHEILIVDHGSRDGTLSVAREYGAMIRTARPGASPAEYLENKDAGDRSRWILCVDQHESATESLAASLYEWKSEAISPGAAFAVFLREETPEGWIDDPRAQTRLVPSDWVNWVERFPAHRSADVTLEGELLRFVFP